MSANINTTCPTCRTGLTSSREGLLSSLTLDRLCQACKRGCHLALKATLLPRIKQQRELPLTTQRSTRSLTTLSSSLIREIPLSAASNLVASPVKPVLSARHPARATEAVTLMTIPPRLNALTVIEKVQSAFLCLLFSKPRRKIYE